jgi:hypothetical protein
MSLNCDYRKLKAQPNDDDERLVLDTLAKLTMSVDLGEITEKNKGEFYARVHAIELLNEGTFLANSSGTRDRPITPEDVERWVGLSTNVVDKSRAYFLKRLSRALDGFAKECK